MAARKRSTDDLVRIPRDLLARLMAAIETPDDLTQDDVAALLEDADHWYPYECGDDDAS